MGGKHSKDTYNVKVVTVKKKAERQPVYCDDPLPPPPARPSSSSSSSSPAANCPVGQSPSSMEAVVAKLTDLENGQMKEVQFGDKKILLVREKDKFYATGNKCTHYGAPLSKGSYCQGVVRCPWHGARFSVQTGDIEDFPGLDGVHVFKTEIRGEDVIVHANPEAVENFRRVKSMVRRSEDNAKTVVLVGGGPSTLVCAETLRQTGFTGKVILLSKETVAPYDRIKLSKAMSVQPEEIALRPMDFYHQHGIDLRLGKQVTSVNVSEKEIQLHGGEVLKYDSLVLGTGGRPRHLSIPGSELENIFVLRTPEDANAIAASGKDKNVLVIGSSFIGMEVSAFLADHTSSVHVVDLVSLPFELTLGATLGCFMQKVASFFVGKAANVHVICRSDVPLQVIFGHCVGAWFTKLHEVKGVQFHFQTNVKEFRGQEGRLTEAELANGEILQVDTCVMGVGVVPATDFLKDSGIAMTTRGFIPVNKAMQTNVTDVYAVGDIVEFPLFTQDDKLVNVQHWQMAHQHGRIAGLNIAGQRQEIQSVPYFWTVQYGKSVRYTGYGPGYDDVIIHGDLDENKFVAFYTKADSVVAVASLGWDPIVSQAAELMAKGGKISKEEVKSHPSSWVSRLCPN